MKRLVGRPRKRRLEDKSSVHNSGVIAKENVRPTGTDGEEPTTDKAIRCQCTSKQRKRIDQYARHHGIRPPQRKLGIPWKNVQQWLKSFYEMTLTKASLRDGRRSVEF